MSKRSASLLVLAVVIATLPAALAGCGAGATDESPAPSASSTPGGAPAGGTKMAPGLYDLEDGTAQAVGTVEYRDLEGGFWAVVGGTEAEGDVGKVVAVIVNGDDFAAQFKELEGLSVDRDGHQTRGRVDTHGRPGDHGDARRRGERRGPGAGGVERRRTRGIVAIRACKVDDSPERGTFDSICSTLCPRANRWLESWRRDLLLHRRRCQRYVANGRVALLIAPRGG